MFYNRMHYQSKCRIKFGLILW